MKKHSLLIILLFSFHFSFAAPVFIAESTGNLPSVSLKNPSNPLFGRSYVIQTTNTLDSDNNLNTAHPIKLLQKYQGTEQPVVIAGCSFLSRK